MERDINRKVYLFCKSVYCYFDNDENAYEAFNALRLKEMVE
jgi:hypothetical protein